jgi:exosome complex RNA-binding protein Csl4
MTTSSVRRVARRGVTAAVLASLGACSSMGGLGNVLGGVLGGQSSNQLSGIVQGVDTRAQQIAVQQSNGQAVWVRYDASTQVVYQNQNYSPTSLERGDQVTASIQDNGNGGYYTNYVRVDQSVRGGNGGAQSSAVQSFQGTVRQVDRGNGWFTVDDPNAGRLTVVLTNGVSRAEVDRFNALRTGDYVRLYGYRANNSQVQLRQFY